jgi:hypothetical protein
MSNLCVAKLRNSPAFVWVSRLDLDHVNAQLVSPGFGKRLLGKTSGQLPLDYHFLPRWIPS